MPDLSSDQKPKDGWKEILGLAFSIGIVLLAAFGGITEIGKPLVRPVRLEEV
jgi:hypothetical protein